MRVYSAPIRPSATRMHTGVDLHDYPIAGATPPHAAPGNRG